MDGGGKAQAERGVGCPSHIRGHGSGDPFPRKGSDTAPWNVQWPPETLPFRRMPGPQAILLLSQGPDLSTLCDQKSDSLKRGGGLCFREGCSTSSDLIPLAVFSVLSRVGPAQKQS